MDNIKNQQTMLYMVNGSYEIINFNKDFQNLVPDVKKGMICYKAIRNQSFPCIDCPLRTKNNNNYYQLLYNEYLDRWFTISTANLNYINENDCNLILLTEFKGTSDSIYRFFKEHLLNSFLFEINIKQDSIKLIYKGDKSIKLPNEKSCLSKMIEEVNTTLVHPLYAEMHRNFWNLNTMNQRLEDSNYKDVLCIKMLEKSIDGHYKQVQQVIVRNNNISEDVLWCFMSTFDDLDNELENHTFNTFLENIGIDAKTGLRNKGSFYKAANDYVKENDNLCMIAIDIHNFWFFNKINGYEEGDALLKTISDKLKTVQDETSGIAGYLGVDDFALIMPYDLTYINNFYDNLIKNLSNVDEYKYKAVLKFGAYKINDSSMPIEYIYDLTKNAYTFNFDATDAKQHISWYDAQDAFNRENEMLLLSDCRKAIENNEFIFYVQPKCNINTGKIISGEALIRWNHPTKGLLYPSSFITIFENYNLITDVNKYVWRAVFKWQKEQLDMHHNIVPLSMNLSIRDMYHIDVPAYFKSLLDEFKIDPKYISVEITENNYGENLDLVNNVSIKLRELGLKVLLDDFGKGNSSLSVLKDIAIDALKLDFNFVQNANHNDRGIKIIESILNMAKTLSLPVIVEGVETKQQLDILKSIGYSFIQGHYFYKPMDVQHFELLLSNRNNIDFEGIKIKKRDLLDLKDLLNESSFFDIQLNNLLGGFAYFEFDNNNIKLLRYNYQFLDLLSLYKESEIGDIMDYVYDLDRYKFISLFEDAKENTIEGAYTTIRFLNSKGNILRVNVHIFFIKDIYGSNSLYYGNLKDVTISYNKDELLRKSQEALSTSLKAIDDPNLDLLIDDNKKIVNSLYQQIMVAGILGVYNDNQYSLYYVNETMIKLLGYDNINEFRSSINNSALNLFHSDDLKVIFNEINFKYFENKVYTKTFRLLSKNKEYRWFLVKGRLAKDNVGNPIAIGVFMDISDIFSSQNDFVISSEFLKSKPKSLSIIENAKRGYFYCSLDNFIFKFINQSFYDLVGYSSEEIEKAFGNSFVNLIYEEDRDRVILKAKNTTIDEVFSDRYRIKTLDGLKWVREQGALINIDGSYYYQSFIMDISDLISIEQADKDLNRRLLAILNLSYDNYWQWSKQKESLSINILNDDSILLKIFDFKNAGKHTIYNLKEFTTNNKKMWSYSLADLKLWLDRCLSQDVPSSCILKFKIDNQELYIKATGTSLDGNSVIGYFEKYENK